MDFLNGFNASLFVYGQTGSGKTFTMFGPSDLLSNMDAQDWGLVPRVCERVLNVMSHRRRLGIQSSLAISMVEIYGNEVTDLLREGQSVGQSRVAGQRSAARGIALLYNLHPLEVTIRGDKPGSEQ